VGPRNAPLLAPAETPNEKSGCFSFSPAFPSTVSLGNQTCPTLQLARRPFPPARHSPRKAPSWMCSVGSPPKLVSSQNTGTAGSQSYELGGFPQEENRFFVFRTPRKTGDRMENSAPSSVNAIAGQLMRPTV